MRLTFTGLAISALVGGCVVSPLDFDELSSRTEPVRFRGYASAGEAELRFQCRQPGASAWTAMGTDTASVSPVNAGESTLLYRFSKNLIVPGSCWANSDFGFRTFVRVLETDASNVPQLFTFTPAGLSCALDELADGEEWVTAGAVCNSGTELNLFASS